MTAEARSEEAFIAQVRSLRTLCEAIFQRSNLISTDFADCSAWNVERTFWQGEGGVLIQFAISHHALGKLMTEEAQKALETLLAEKSK